MCYCRPLAKLDVTLVEVGGTHSGLALGIYKTRASPGAYIVQYAGCTCISEMRTFYLIPHHYHTLPMDGGMHCPLNMPSKSLQLILY